MSDLLAEQLKKDVSGFESRVANLRERKEELAREIDQVDADINGIQPLYTYAKSLLDKSRTAAATAASVAARKAKGVNKAEEKSPNS